MKLLIEEKGVIWDSANFKNLKQKEVVNWFNKIPKKWTKDISKFYVKCFEGHPEYDVGGFFLEEEGKHFIYLKDCFPKGDIKYIFCHELGHLIWELFSKEEKDRFIANTNEEDVFQLKDDLRESEYWDYEKVCKHFYNEMFAWKFADSMENDGRRI